jgi:hypothetical protein
MLKFVILRPGSCFPSLCILTAPAHVRASVGIPACPGYSGASRRLIYSTICQRLPNNRIRVKVRKYSSINQVIAKYHHCHNEVAFRTFTQVFNFNISVFVRALPLA